MHSVKAEQRPLSIDQVASLQHLFEEHRERIYRIGLRFTQDPEEARDILQETFVRAHRALHQFRGQAQVSTWLTRITINICLNLRRDRRHERLLCDTTFDLGRLAAASPGRTPEEEYLLEEFRTRVRRVLLDFPPRQRLVFLLKHYEHLKIREISAMLNIREGTVKAFLNRSLKMLRRRLYLSLEGL
ncbi:MAG: RNA polymerase sigma factor [Acidobacteriota bacterium]